MNERLKAARERVTGLCEAVQAAHVRRDELRADDADAAAQREADAELRLQREALEQARTDLAEVEKHARRLAKGSFNVELRNMARLALRDVDAVPRWRDGAASQRVAREGARSPRRAGLRPVARPGRARVARLARSFAAALG